MIRLFSLETCIHVVRSCFSTVSWNLYSSHLIMPFHCLLFWSNLISSTCQRSDVLSVWCHFLDVLYFAFFGPCPRALLIGALLGLLNNYLNFLRIVWKESTRDETGHTLMNLMYPRPYEHLALHIVTTVTAIELSL